MLKTNILSVKDKINCKYFQTIDFQLIENDKIQR